MDHLGQNDRPRSHWASVYTPGTDFDCRLLHQQHKEVKPLLRRKNVNEAIDKRKLFSSNRHMTFVQYEPPAHAAKATQAWCKRNLPNFIEKTSWPPNSPEINPVGNLWSIMYEVVYQDPSPKDLKRLLKQAWKNIPLSMLYDLSHTDSMPQQLQNVIKKHKQKKQQQQNKGGMSDIELLNTYTR